MVDDEEIHGSGRAFTWDMRRAEVEGFTEKSAAKQFRLRQISDNNIYRPRNFVSNLDTEMEEPPLATNSTAATTFKHIVEILNMQNFEGDYFNSLSADQKESVKDYLCNSTPGKY